MKMKKGYCSRRKKFYGMVTVTNKGQLAIPAELRKELGIDKGDKLIVIKRDDGNGLNLIKGDMIEDFLGKLAD